MLLGGAGVVAGAEFWHVLAFGVLPGVLLGLWKGDAVFDFNRAPHGL